MIIFGEKYKVWHVPREKSANTVFVEKSHGNNFGAREIDGRIIIDIQILSIKF